MALRGVQRSVADYHGAATKVTPAREWHDPERRHRPRDRETDDGLSPLGKVLKRYTLATLAGVASVLTGMPQHSDDRLKEPSDGNHA